MSKEIYIFNNKIDESIIIKTVEDIEKILIKNGEECSKIRNISKVLIEVMQNILNNSYNITELPDDRREATGTLSLLYDIQKKIYTLNSSNLIKENQEQIIKYEVLQLDNLDNRGLRKLARKKMKSREGNHEKGAGLGLISIAKICHKPIGVSFKNIENNIKSVIFQFVI